MPRQDFSLTEWVKDLAAGGSLTPQQVAALEESLKPVAGKVGESVLRQSEFDRFFNAKKAEFEQKEQSLNSFQQTLQQHRDQIDGLYKRSLTRAELAENEANALKARLGVIGETYNLPEEDLRVVSAAAPPNPNPAAPPQFDTSKFVDNEQYRRNLDTLARTPFYMAEVADIEREHRELFPDKPLTQSQIVAAAMEAKVNPNEWWEKAYQVSGKRKEIEWGQREKLLRSQWDTEQAQRASSHAVGVLNPNIPVGPVLSLRTERQPQPNEPGAARRNGADRVAAAAGAYAQHKYSAENRRAG